MAPDGAALVTGALNQPGVFRQADQVASAAVDVIRERVRAIPADRRHVLVVNGQEIEVVEISAVEDALASR